MATGHKESVELKTSGVDVSVSWEEIKNKPTKFNPIEHTHDIAWGEVIGKPTEYTPEYHTHDEYAKRYHKHTVEDIIGLEGYNANGTDSNHNHDDRYYTKSKTDEIIERKLDLKADREHIHNINDLDGLESIIESYKEYNVIESELSEDEDGFYVYSLDHGLNSKSLEILVFNSELKELIVDVTIISLNEILILTDAKEDLTILVKKINLN